MTVCVFRIIVWLQGGSHEVISAVLAVCVPTDEEQDQRTYHTVGMLPAGHTSR